MKVWEARQLEKGYLTWREYMEAVKEDWKLYKIVRKREKIVA